MFKNINWLGVFALFLSLFALFLSATFYLFILGMFVACIALIVAYYTPKTVVVKVSQVFSVIVLLFGTTLFVIALF